MNLSPNLRFYLATGRPHTKMKLFHLSLPFQVACTCSCVSLYLARDCNVDLPRNLIRIADLRLIVRLDVRDLSRCALTYGSQSVLPFKFRDGVNSPQALSEDGSDRIGSTTLADSQRDCHCYGICDITPRISLYRAFEHLDLDRDFRV